MASPTDPVDGGAGALSAKEQALWLFQRFTDDLGVLSIPSAYRMGRPLAAEPLQRTVDHLIGRHPALRTVFPEVDGVPVRRVLPAGDPAASCPVDRMEVAADNLPAELTRFTRIPFAIESAIPIRVGHFVGDPEGEVVCFVIQHIACDAETFGVLIRELGRLYTALAAGVPIPGQLAGIVPAYVERPATRSDIDYWRAHLDGAGDATRTLDVGRPGARRSSFDAGLSVMPLSEPAVAGVRTLADELSMTPNIVLFTLFGLLLSISGAGQDMVLGVPIDVRDRSARDVVGYHVNLLAIRVPMPGTATLRETARAARHSYLEGVMHANASLDEVFPGSYEGGSDWQRPVLRHMFNYRPYRGIPADNAVSMAGVEVDTRYTRLDLQVSLFAEDDRLSVAVTYSEELFDEKDVQALLDRFDLLIRVCSEFPDMTLADLAVLAAPIGGVLDTAPEPVDAEPAPDAGSVDTARSGAERELAEVLAGLWRTVLQEPDLDVEAHFFHSGGTSLRAAQLVARVKVVTGAKLSLRHVFKAPTPRKLAHLMVEQGIVEAGS